MNGNMESKARRKGKSDSYPFIAILNNNKMNNTAISYIPSFKGVVISEYVRPEILVPSSKASKIIKVSEIKDSELLELGLNSKGAMVANKNSEDQSSFVIVAIGPKVDTEEFKVGDRVLLRQAAQPMGIEVDGKIYGQVWDYEICGKML